MPRGLSLSQKLSKSKRQGRSRMSDLRYSIALINVFWSENDINTRYFDTIEDQSAYFENLAGGFYTPLLNFNMGNNVETSIVYRDASPRSVSELLSCNYAIINEHDANGDIVNRRYYYAYPKQDSGRQMIVVLSLDDIQTNYFKHKNTIAPCLIRRANLNRWIDNNDGSVSFNGCVDSPLFACEPLNNVAKRLTKRTPLNIAIDETSDDSDFNQWCFKNVVGWEYVYLTTGHEYTFYSPGASEEKKTVTLKPIKTIPFEKKLLTPVEGTNLINSSSYEGVLVCICAPVYNNDSFLGRDTVIRLQDSDDPTKTISITTQGLDSFIAANGGNSYVYARKFSLIPPFVRQKWSPSSYTIDPAFNTLTIKGVGSDLYYKPDVSVYGIQTGKLSYSNEVYYQGVFYVTQQGGGGVLTESYTIDKPLTFQKSEIVGSLKDPRFNPKLLNQQFFDLNVVQASQSFTYDLQKLNKNQIKVQYTEGLTPDVTKGYARIYDTSGVYIKECGDNFTGLVYSNDQSLMVDNDQLSQMLANNKNFFLQQGINIGKDLVNSFQSGKPLEGLFNTAFDIIDQGLTLDNMRHAPHQVQNANGNVYFASLVQPLKLTIEEYDLLDTEKQSINDLMTRFGFLFNRIGRLADFDNIRHYYNYIEADVESITAPISNLEKERLRDRLKSVRFWNSDTIQYNLENYERSLENE